MAPLALGVCLCVFESVSFSCAPDSTIVKYYVPKIIPHFVLISDTKVMSRQISSLSMKSPKLFEVEITFYIYQQISNKVRS